MIEIKDYENEEENEIISKDEFINNDELNNKVEVNYNNYKSLKKNLINSKNNKLSLSSKFNKGKKMKIKKNNFKDNPFLTQNSLPNYTKFNKKVKILPTSVYCFNVQNDKSEIKNEYLGKSIFSKISETILQNEKNEMILNKKILNLEKINEDNYNQLTEELYLHSKAYNPSNINNKIITEFLKRKKREEILKKIKIENDSNNMSQTLKDLKRSNTLTDRNRSFKSTRTFKEFLQDQKNKEERHLFLLKKNAILQKERINLNIRDRPLLNEESKKLINKSVRDKMDIHQRLYQDFNDKRKREEEKEKEKEYLFKNKEKKMSKKKIEENSNRLFNEYKYKRNRNDEIKNRRLKEMKNLTFNSVSKNSNDIIFRKLIQKLIDSIKNLYGKKIEDDFELNYNDFLKLLYNISFLSKNYSELINKSNNSTLKHNIKLINFDSEMEYKLSKDAWKLITNKKQFNNNALGQSKRILFFILSTFGLYNGRDYENKNIKKECKKLKIELNSIESNLSSQIYKYFHFYRSNAINSLLFREAKRKKIGILNENESDKLDKNTKRIFKNNNSNDKEKYYNDIELKNKKKRQKNVKFKEQEKIIYSFIPSLTQYNETSKKNENSKNCLNLSATHIKSENKDNNKNGKNNLINNSFNSNNYLRKMFLNNPLEKDNDIQKKINGLKEARNQRIIDKMIKEKGIRINDIGNKNDNNINYYNERFVLSDEPLNNFKNTFKKYEKISAKKKILPKEKYVFEIYVENKPKKLIINKGDDININIKDFCNKYNLNYNEKKQIIMSINNQIKDMNKEIK